MTLPLALALESAPRSSRYLAAQHHHAHVASCLAEHRHVGPAIGVAFDDFGHVPGGMLSGGEFLHATLAAYERIGHLTTLPLPGAAAAIRAPWRVALAALIVADEPADVMHDVPLVWRRAIQRMVAFRIGTPLSTGAGRWLDALATLSGIRCENSAPGQVAAEFERIADREPCSPYAVAVRAADRVPFEADLRPAVREVACDVRNGVSRAMIAARVHETMAHLVLEGCRRARERGAPSIVALSGSGFRSLRLRERTVELLTESAFEVLVPRSASPRSASPRSASLRSASPRSAPPRSAPPRSAPPRSALSQGALLYGVPSRSAPELARKPLVAVDGSR